MYMERIETMCAFKCNKHIRDKKSRLVCSIDGISMSDPGNRTIIICVSYISMYIPYIYIYSDRLTAPSGDMSDK